MIIWLNGAFGSGKTQTAYELHRRLPGSCVYDPENAGYFIRENLPASIRTADFQDYPMWTAFNLEMLSYIAAHWPGHIIVPMTVTNRAYYDALIGGLSKQYQVRHFILCAEKSTLLRRLASRLEGPHSWAARQIDRCIQAFETDITEYKLHTDKMSLDQVVEQVATLAGIPLTEDRQNRFHKLFHRLLTKIRHIR